MSLNNFIRRKTIPVQVDALTGYAHWAKNYPAKAHNPLMAIEEEAMLALLPPLLSDKVCLDLACGSGSYCRLLQLRQAGQVFGLDYSPDMLAEAQAINPDLRLARSPFLALPYPAETFNLITCGLAVGHEQNLDRVMAEMARVLRPGGVIVYSDFHPFGALAGWQRAFRSRNGLILNLKHYVHLYGDHLRACQAAGLKIETILEPAGGKHASQQFKNAPVVLVIRTVKSSCKEPDNNAVG